MRSSPAPQRLAFAVCEGPPDPLDGTEPEVAQPEYRERDLDGPDRDDVDDATGDRSNDEGGDSPDDGDDLLPEFEEMVEDER